MDKKKSHLFEQKKHLPLLKKNGHKFKIPQSCKLIISLNIYLNCTAWFLDLVIFLIIISTRNPAKIELQA